MTNSEKPTLTSNESNARRDSAACEQAWHSFANREPAPDHKDCFRGGWVAGKGYARDNDAHETRAYPHEDPRLPRFYTERKCSQCGIRDEIIAEQGCPERCGRLAEKAAQASTPEQHLVVICAECSMRNWNDWERCGLCERLLNGQLVQPYPGELETRRRRDAQKASEQRTTAEEWENAKAVMSGEMPLPPCECTLRDKAPSAYHNAKCPRFVAGKL